MALLILLFGSGSAAAESQPASDEPDEVDRRIHLLMWTYHVREPQRGFENNWAFGVSYRWLYGATFINSFGERAYSAGVQGLFARWDTGPATLGLGYRVGVIAGYDERLMALAGRSPVVPLLQPRLTIDRRRFGVELTYSGVVASAGANVRF